MTDAGDDVCVDGTEYHDHYGIVGDCAGCGGQMIETACLETDEERRATLECQDCGAEAELRHDFEDGLEGGSWSGVGNPEFKPLNWIQCFRCHGHGYVEDPICDLRRAMNGREHPCPNCHTVGKVPRVVETDGGTVEGGTERAVDKSDPDNTGSPKRMRAKCLECGRLSTGGCVTVWFDVVDGRSVPRDDVSFLCSGCDQVNEQKIEIVERWPGGVN